MMEGTTYKNQTYKDRKFDLAKLYDAQDPQAKNDKYFKQTNWIQGVGKFSYEEETEFGTTRHEVVQVKYSIHKKP